MYVYIYIYLYISMYVCLFNNKRPNNIKPIWRFTLINC